MYYKQVDLKEGELVLFVGCHVVKWPYSVQEPDVGFVEADDIVDKLLEALRRLLESEDIDIERPPWTTQGIHGRVGCGYCGHIGNDTEDIEHAEDLCPIPRALAAIAKAEGRKLAQREGA